MPKEYPGLEVLGGDRDKEVAVVVLFDKNVDRCTIPEMIFPTKNPGVHFKLYHIGVETRSILFNYQRGFGFFSCIILEASIRFKRKKILQPYPP